MRTRTCLNNLGGCFEINCSWSGIEFFAVRIASSLWRRRKYAACQSSEHYHDVAAARPNGGRLQRYPLRHGRNGALFMDGQIRQAARRTIAQYWWNHLRNADYGGSSSHYRSSLR